MDTRISKNARKAFDRLTNNGVPPQELVNGLIALFAATRHHQNSSKKRAEWKRDCGAPAGMTWSQFSRRPKMYGDLAREIENINSSPYYAPDIWQGASSARRRAAGLSYSIAPAAPQPSCSHETSATELQVGQRHGSCSSQSAGHQRH